MIFSRVESVITWARVYLPPPYPVPSLPLLPLTLRSCVRHTGNQKGLVYRVGSGLADKSCVVQCYTGSKVRTKGVRSNNLGFHSIKSFNLDAKKQMANFRTLVYSTIPILLEIY